METIACTPSTDSVTTTDPAYLVPKFDDTFYLAGWLCRIDGGAEGLPEVAISELAYAPEWLLEDVAVYREGSSVRLSPWRLELRARIFVTSTAVAHSAAFCLNTRPAVPTARAGAGVLWRTMHHAQLHKCWRNSAQRISAVVPCRERCADAPFSVAPMGYRLLFVVAGQTCQRKRFQR